MNAMQRIIEETGMEFLFEPNNAQVRSELCQTIRDRLQGHVVTSWDDEELETPLHIQRVVYHDDTTPEDVNNALVRLQFHFCFKEEMKPVAVLVSIGGPECQDIGDWVTVIRPDIGPPRG